MCDVTAAVSEARAVAERPLVVQVQTKLMGADGEPGWLRVQTVAREWARPGAVKIRQGFDQEAAAAAVARMAAFRLERGDRPTAVLRWVEDRLVDVGRSFGNFAPREPSSFAMPPEFELFPQLMFHLW